MNIQITNQVMLTPRPFPLDEMGEAGGGVRVEGEINEMVISLYGLWLMKVW